MAERITLSGDYGLQQTRLNLQGSTDIDATNARWVVANIGSETNRYPVFIENGDNVSLNGGTIDGRIPLDMDWRQAYINSAAIYARNTDQIEINDWTIDRAWDAIRVHGDRNDTFEIENVYMSNVRDDAVENDMGLSGTIKNSFFDGVFVGLSTSDENTGDMSGNKVTLDNVLMRIEPYLYKGSVTHGSPFKVWTNSPKMDIQDSVIAIQNPNHFDYQRLKIAWDLVENSSNNYYLNLSDKPFPKDYPLPGKGFTVLQGQAARDYWAKASAEWTGDGTNDDDDSSGDLQDKVLNQEINPGNTGKGGGLQESKTVLTRGVAGEEGQSEQDSESANSDEDDGGPKGFFAIFAKIFQALFGFGRGSDDDDDDDAVVTAEGSGLPEKNFFSEEDLGSIMLPPAFETGPVDDYDDEDGLAFV